MSRMFDKVTHTWNPVVGCTHRCRYCWALKMVERGRLKGRYRDFQPKFFPERLEKIPHRGFVFVVDMGDLFSDGVPDEWIRQVFEAIIYSGSKATFLFLTKNPRRYHDFLDYYRDNMLFGATIETNRYYNGIWERAPEPYERFYSMLKLPKKIRKFISIEPILNFDLDIMRLWIQVVNPELIYIGYDNYNNNLPEPPLNKTLRLISDLQSRGFNIRTKTLRERWDR